MSHQRFPHQLASPVGGYGLFGFALTGLLAVQICFCNGAPKQQDVLTGIDVLERDRFRPLKGRKIGLITNQTGINRDGVTTIKLLHQAKDVQLVALFSPEHGIEGKLDVRSIADSQDAATKLRIYSLYGKTRAPTKESLKGVDTLVFDVQDVGTRFYTYVSTMGLAMKAAAEHGIRFVVLDRPNPINGRDVQGPVLDAGSESFVGFHRLPVRHGMTIGELATMFNAELKLKLDLHVIKMEGWRRSDYFDATGLRWVNPSPNMRSLTQALLYPGIGLLETTNVSVGRGTDTPFEVVGAPWIEARQLARRLNGARLPGVRFVPIAFTPSASKHKGKLCQGVNVIITNRAKYHPLHVGFELALAVRELYANNWEAGSYNRLLASRKTRDALLAKQPVAQIRAAHHADLEAFHKRRAKFLLYD